MKELFLITERQRSNGIIWKLGRLFLVLTIALLSIPVPSFAYEVPAQDSKIETFYLFGPEGDPLDGKEDTEFVLYIDVPENASGDVVVKVNDPDIDAGTMPYTTGTKFAISGASKLDSRSFGEDEAEGLDSFQFGPYAKTEGEKVGDKYRFTLKVTTSNGDDLNLFSFSITPNSAESFSKKFTFSLLPPGGVGHFYPEIPAGIKNLTVRNFDLDKEGGISTLQDPSTKKKYSIKDSESGEWADTVIPISSDVTRRLVYTVKTTQQQFGHGGLEFLDDNGNALPIYFRKGPAVKAPAPKPVLACNEFVFDARKSYDPDKTNITYLWDFGDGSTSDQPVVSHLYEQGGSYKVNLTVSDNSGLQCEKSVTSQSIDVNTPPQAAFSAQDLACVNESVTLDASATQDNDLGQVSYSWNLGDGTQAEGKTVTKSYEKGGVYDVILNVDDNAGTKCSADSVRRTVRVNTPPTADAGNDISMCLRGSQDQYRVILNGAGSGDADGGSLSYRWDFGDGSQGEGEKVEHVYAQGGSYTAKLLVADDSGASCSNASDEVKIDLNKSPIAAAGQDQRVCAGTPVAFDGSASSGETGSLNYQWDFGDGGSATGQTATHTYEKGGNYQTVLTVNDGKGSACSEAIDGFQVHVNSGPQVTLEDVSASCVGDKVSFVASGSDPDGDSLKHFWDFGDGTTAEGGSKMSHQYENGGTYKVTIRVDDGSGLPCADSADSTTVKVNTPPTAKLGPNLTCCVDDSSPFDAAGSSDPDGDTLSYHWDLGDGSTSTSSSLNHSYSKSGSYPVVLIVDDNSGTACSSASASFTADVNTKPVSVIEIRQK